jgi:hypothetical protein
LASALNNDIFHIIEQKQDSVIQYYCLKQNKGNIMSIKSITTFTLGAATGITAASLLGVKPAQEGVKFAQESIAKLASKTYKSINLSNLTGIAITTTITNYMLKNWILPSVRSIIKEIRA